MRRMKSDRGAVGIIVALMMVPLLVCTALVVDVGAAYPGGPSCRPLPMPAPWQ